MRKLALIVVVLAVTAVNAPAVLIDKFTDAGDHLGNPAVIISNDGTGVLPKTMIVAQGPGMLGVLGGYRTQSVKVTADSAPGTNVSKFSVIPGFPTGTGQTSNDVGVNSELLLQYGFYAGFPFGPVDLTADSGMIINVAFSDLTGKVVVTLHADGTSYASPVENITVGSGAYPVPFTDFPVALMAHLGHVDGVQYDFTGATSWDMSFSFLGTTSDIVPEPATMSLLALGALALLRRRRRKS